MKTILLTGGAGFIGSHLAERLLNTGRYRVICIDNLDDFYEVRLKRENLEPLLAHPGFHFIEADITTLSPDNWQAVGGGEKIDQIIHLAARAGVRPSIADPAAYYRTNVTGTVNLLEFARQAGIRHFIFTSSSSVYGDHPGVPWKESLSGLCPVSPYAASKAAGEELGRVYARLYDIRFVALRLFTVYGPRQRPDLAIHKFYNLMKAGKAITLYGEGAATRDYTFVGDTVNGIMAAADTPPVDPFAIFNIGSGRPVSLLNMVRSLEEAMHMKAKIRFTGEQPGDVKQTWADVTLAEDALQYHAGTSFEEGINSFLQWKETVTAVAY